jgi:hypothetical protein
MIQIAYSTLPANSAETKDAFRMTGPAIINERNPQDSIVLGKI